MVGMAEIQNLCARIVSSFHPQKVLLFGSYAHGTATPDSDVDILVVMPFAGKGFRKSLEILNEMNPSFPTDLLVRRPEDVARRYEECDPLIREALDMGKVLYERDS